MYGSMYQHQPEVTEPQSNSGSLSSQNSLSRLQGLLLELRLDAERTDDEQRMDGSHIFMCSPLNHIIYNAFLLIFI